MPLATYPDVIPGSPYSGPVPLLVLPHRRATLVARDGAGPRSGIRLAGPGETAFFAC